MAHDINSALEKLEKNLGELDSARLQVLKSVNASNDLLKMVTLYVTAVKKVAASLEQWDSSLSARESELHGEFKSAISSIRQRCTEIISVFNADVNKATSEFKTETDKTLEKFTEQNDKLAAKVEELVSLREQIKKTTAEIESVKSSLNEILKELKDSQDEQDASLEKLRQNISYLSEQFEKGKDLVLQAISQSELSMSDILSHTNERIESISNKAEALAENITKLTTVCHNIETVLHSSSDNITSVINKTKDDILKTAIFNRWLIIAGIVALAILQYLF